ncbi:MAG TPA: hypothetical protein VHO06_18515, partial [Polyangia bacterium]|nr:hypothetical protein [Polyangia bacterium]
MSRLPVVSFVLVVALAACSGGGKARPDAAGPPAADAGAAADSGVAGPLPFQADPPAVYVAKVKNLLVGLAPTADEVAAVTADPTQLQPLIQEWMQLPQYAQKMQRFFELAFQQTQITSADFADQFYPKQIDDNGATTPLLLQNLQESFARTMLALIAAGQPLTAATTTNQLMMTTALKELYAFLDVWEVDDGGKVTDRFKQANPNLQITVESSAGAIPIAQTLDATNAAGNYMHWYDPDVATANASVPGCTMDPIVYPPSAFTLHWLLYGTLDGHKLADGTNCPPVGGSATAAQLTAADFSDWAMVTIRPPKKGEATTTFYDLPTLRGATTLVLSIPRLGFFSTPAFFANWQTNVSNQMRVTMNQTLIVALGAQVDGSDTTVPPVTPPPGLDTTHAAQPACAHCHVTLDPTRSIFAATYSWNYHDQLDTTWSSQPGEFVFQGVVAQVTSMTDLGNTLAAHPFFAPAWVEKLCYYASSGPCDPADPEFQRLVSLFQSSSYSWGTLVAALFASPLVTNATATETTTAHGETVAVSRRDHLCAALDSRLGLDDVCGLRAVTKKQMTATVPEIVSGLPSDGYGRGSTIPVLPNQPSLFYRAATENICAAVATQVIDVAAGKQADGGVYWSSSDPDGAIADFV